MRWCNTQRVYADQVELDFKAFKAAVRSGRLWAKTTESDLKDLEI